MGVVNGRSADALGLEIGVDRQGRAEQFVTRLAGSYSAVMGLRDWELVFVMSTDPVAQSMRVRYAGNNPQNPFVMYGRERAIRVRRST